MEEVWKDITTLSTLPDTPLPSSHHNLHNHHHHHHHNNTTTPTTTAFRSMILQDFLSRPSSTSTSSGAGLYCSSPSPITGVTAPPPSPPISGPHHHRPATALSLNSTNPEFTRFLDHHHHHHHHTPPNPITQTDDDIEILTNPPAHMLGGSFATPDSRKRFFDGEALGGGSAATGDRRHKRMIKNRESAARSRARKQAYINELELEVANLMEENARLRKQQQHQQQQLFQGLPTSTSTSSSTTSGNIPIRHHPSHHHRFPQKHVLQRSSTAPF